MDQRELHERIIETADEYHLVAEEQWGRAVDVEPVNDETDFEFRRLIRAAIRFYLRAFLMLEMVETDDEQQVEELLEVLGELEPELDEFFAKNNALEVLDEDSHAPLTRVFGVAEAMRNVLLERSNAMAASLGNRF